jgi:cytochrome P450
MGLPLPRHRRFHAALGAVHEVVDRIVAARHQRQNESTDLLSLLLSARDEDGSELTDEELRNQVVTFLLAGHETTASTVTWAFAALDQHPAELQLVETELDANAITGAEGRTVDTLSALTRLHAVLQETMRLFPAIWIAERRVVRADQLGDFSLPANSSVIVAPYVTHRLARWWPEPDKFRPARFANGEARTLANGFFPFGGGPHICIGQHFAMMEAKIVLSGLLARFRVSLVDNTMPSALGGITLRAESAVPVRIAVRRR